MRGVPYPAPWFPKDFPFAEELSSSLLDSSQVLPLDPKALGAGLQGRWLYLIRPDTHTLLPQNTFAGLTSLFPFHLCLVICRHSLFTGRVKQLQVIATREAVTWQPRGMCLQTAPLEWPALIITKSSPVPRQARPQAGSSFNPTLGAVTL